MFLVSLDHSDLYRCGLLSRIHHRVATSSEFDTRVWWPAYQKLWRDTLVYYHVFHLHRNEWNDLDENISDDIFKQSHDIDADDEGDPQIVTDRCDYHRPAEKFRHVSIVTAPSPMFASASIACTMSIAVRPCIPSFGADSIDKVKFSAVGCDLLTSTVSDRSIVLYDVHQRTPLHKIILLMQTNSLCFSPIAAYYFITGNEDHNADTFGLRCLDHACVIHSDHVSAVMTSPTGAEFVTGSCDRATSVQEWTGSSSTISAGDSAHSHEVYHSKRLHRIHCSINQCAQFSHGSPPIMPLFGPKFLVRWQQ